MLALGLVGAVPGWHSEGFITERSEEVMQDAANTTDELHGHADALYRTLGLLVRQLHIKRIIDAPDLVQEMHLVAAQLDTEQPRQAHCKIGMEGIAASFQRDLAVWQEERTVADLYQTDPDGD